MNFTRDHQSPLTIRKIEPGAITIGDEVVTDDVVIFRDEIRPAGVGSDIAELGEGELESLLAQKPELLILGTGSAPQHPPRELMFALARRGIGFEVMDTAAACRTFNILLAEGRDAAAVLKVGD